MNEIKSKSSARERILNTARTMLEEIGYTNLNVNTLAEEANVAIGTLYWHFKKGKLSITKELAKEETFEVFDFLSNLSLDPEHPIDSLKPFILMYIEHHEKNKALVRAFEIEVLNYPERSDEFSDIMNSETEPTMKIIQALIKKVNLTIPNFEASVKTMTLLLDDLVHKQVLYANRYGTNEELADLIIQLLRTFFE